MRAISVWSLETGTSTRWCLAAAALRRRVRKSAMGSVCITLLPAGFHDAGDFTVQRHTAKTESAHLEFADIPARARGSTTLHRRSRNLYIRSPRKVTAQPMGMPLRILKFSMDFFARVITAFCPVI